MGGKSQLHGVIYFWLEINILLPATQHTAAGKTYFIIEYTWGVSISVFFTNFAAFTFVHFPPERITHFLFKFTLFIIYLITAYHFFSPVSAQIKRNAT